MLLTNNSDLWDYNGETLVWVFFKRKKITYLGIMLSIKARKLEGEYSKLASGAAYPQLIENVGEEL